MKEPEPAARPPQPDVAEPPLDGALTRLNARVARLGMFASVGGLFMIVAIVFFQVFGRYVLNSSPTWTESLALVLVLYVTLIGAAVGVRDAGHIGMESLLVLVPEQVRNRVELLIHALVMLFGAAMIWNGGVLGLSVASYKIPNLGLPEAIRYVPLVLSGVLIISFSIEHVIALVQGKLVEPSWH
ncbi:C4-dicarboxylate ABC transporter permease [Rubrivivax sp. A210]|nr:C4-dicarboxylate ABC transporter permease [Rubrivivax sp. A210]